jgi:hypothetical protein
MYSLRQNTSFAAHHLQRFSAKNRCKLSSDFPSTTAAKLLISTAALVTDSLSPQPAAATIKGAPNLNIF